MLFFLIALAITHNFFHVVAFIFISTLPIFLPIFFKDIPAQWAKIRQGLDIFRISSKCVYVSNGEV